MAPGVGRIFFGGSRLCGKYFVCGVVLDDFKPLVAMYLPSNAMKETH